MSDICVKLPDGAEKKLKNGSTSLDLAKEISSSLAKKVIAAKINGKLSDVQDPLSDGDEVLLLDNKSKEANEIISHSCEHVLALAVTKLFPNAQVTMGPQDHSEGFYYDFDIGRPFTEEDLEKIEQKMKDLIKSDITFTKRILPKAEAKEYFSQLGQKYKPEILDWIKDDEVSLYESGDFVDLCRGPHLPNAKFIKAFKLLGSSGSYWRADASKEMLQRIFGVAFSDKKMLEEYLFRIEEAKKRDHRKLGPKHGLFFVSERFDSWQEEKEVPTEARVLINLGQKSQASSVVLEAQKLLDNIKEVLESKDIKTKGFNILPADDERSSIDIRIFASVKDFSCRKKVLSLSSEINESLADVDVKCFFETHATEEIGPGLAMWLPNGGRLRSLIEDFSRRKHFSGGYEMVYSPHIAKSDLWRISGHLGFYSDSMFAPMNIDGNEYLLKPMNCPFHVLMFKQSPKSYRDLPLRMAEFGTVYRYEMAGVLHGLMRVRGFTQDDAHIFCRWDQLDNELDRVIKFITEMLNAFGFSEFEVNISTRPSKFVGEVADWDRSENSLKEAVKRAGLSFVVDEEGGAFYGPKIDIKLKDSLGRMWQCSTVQLDFNNPERFNLEYVNSSGKKERPVMLHRALFGSIERFIGVLIEHYAGSFPAWLSPEQVRVLTISDRHNNYAKEVLETLIKHGVRAKFTESSDKLGAKIRAAQVDKVPFMVIVGDKEEQEKGATLRLRSMEDKGFFVLDDLVEEIGNLCREPA